jgi:hypothetical protein
MIGREPSTVTGSFSDNQSGLGNLVQYVKFVPLCAIEKPLPFGSGIKEHGAVRVLRVTDGDPSPGRRDLDASSIRDTAARLSPGQIAKLQ